jgi:hypothetical protein
VWVVWEVGRWEFEIGQRVRRALSSAPGAVGWWCVGDERWEGDEVAPTRDDQVGQTISDRVNHAPAERSDALCNEQIFEEVEGRNAVKHEGLCSHTIAHSTRMDLDV